LQKEEQNKKLYNIVYPIPESIVKRKNKAKSFQYGYNEKYDIVVISRNGTIGEVWNINGVNVAYLLFQKQFIKEIKTNQNNTGNLLSILKIYKK
jgi:hypothetical protein